MNIDSLRDSRVLVTGATGFLGRHLLHELAAEGIEEITGLGNSYRICGVDLTDLTALLRFIDRYGPFDIIWHLAGYNGGISLNLGAPATIFYRNSVMGLNVLEASRRTGVRKVVSAVASCAYPSGAGAFVGNDYQTGVLHEEDFYAGDPHESVAGHGWAKRNLQLASSFYRKQYGLMAVCACPTTLYGEGDSFDLHRTKVMGAMIKRFVDAVDKNKQEVVCWGSGKPLREFLYAPDAARLLVQTMLHYKNSDIPLNLGTGQELSIKELAETVARCVGFDGDIIWDTSKPDGQMRKRLDLTHMHEILPAQNFTNLEDGIRQTIAYYRKEAV